jgi:hypothetical protein
MKRKGRLPDGLCYFLRVLFLAGSGLALLKGFGTDVFGTESTVLSAFTNRAPASEPSIISAWG